MKKCFLYETMSPVNEMHVHTSNGLMTLSGTFGVAGVKNNNSRVYEKSNYASMVSEMQKRIKEDGGVPGELEHPEGMNINLENISHKIVDISIDENGVVTGTLQLLNTPKGKIAQSIVEGGLPLFVSSRAMGMVDKAGNVTLEKLATYDLVGSPGFSQARMHLNESQICESINDNIYMIVEKENPVVEEPVAEPTKSEDTSLEEHSLEEQVKELKDLVEALSDHCMDLENKLDEAKTNIAESLAPSIQAWVVNEYSPILQEWIVKEYSAGLENWLKDDFMNVINESTRKDFTESLAPVIEKWVIEEYGEQVKDWITEDYSKQIENWVVESVAPGIQTWIVDHFSPEVENWLNESFTTKIGDMIQENLKDSKESKLKNISETLSLLESFDMKKPVYGGNVINEDLSEPLYLRSMPDSIRPQYNMAPEMVKESIARRAKISDLSSPEKIQRFWENINFDEIRPAENIYEGLNNIENDRERAIRAAFRRKRNNL